MPDGFLGYSSGANFLVGSGDDNLMINMLIGHGQQVEYMLRAGLLCLDFKPKRNMNLPLKQAINKYGQIVVQLIAFFGTGWR
jgi:hypothetical protein